MTFWAKLKTKAGVLIVAAVMGAGARVAMSADDQGRKLPGSDIIPAERLADWRPGVTVGVPGGIPTDRNKLIDVTKDPYNADKTGATDASGAIQKAVDDAKDKDVVYLPEGTYREEKPVFVKTKSNITIRGDGPEKTVLMYYCTWGGVFNLGNGADYEWKNAMNITGSPRKGETVLNVGSTKILDGYKNGGVGMLCHITLKNDLKLPVIAPAHWENLRRGMTGVVAKTATTVTISPALLYDLPEGLEPRVAVATSQVEFVGIEDLKVDGANSKTGALINMEQCYGCWMKNVTVVNTRAYDIFPADSLQCEVRHCYIGGRKGAFGPNGGGLVMETCSSWLVEDSIVADTFPDMMITACSGNVIAYNFCDDRAIQGDILGCSMNSNHGAQCSFNLYEGNYCPRFQCDGYHGSGSNDTVFRNWFHGTSTKTDQYWVCVDLNRFTRYYNLVGNILGKKGYAWIYDNTDPGYPGGGYDQHYIYLLGMPNMGNLSFNGRVQASKGKNWADWDKMLAAAPGKGPGPNGFQELDLDVAATTIRLGNFNYKDNGVPASESLKGKQLPVSLYLEKKPAWFGNMSWPAFGPDVDFEKNKIPAQVRYEEMVKDGK